MNNNLSDAKVNALLAMAGKALGKSPEELKANLESGNVNTVLAALPPDKKARLAAMLKNPSALEELMKNEQVRKLLGKQ